LALIGVAVQNDDTDQPLRGGTLMTTEAVTTEPAASTARPSRLRRKLLAFTVLAGATVVPATALAATPAFAKSAKCGVVSYDPVTHTSVVVCSRNRP